MLTVKVTARNNSSNTGTITENEPCYSGSRLSREDMEKTFHLPIGYKVGYKSYDDNFVYEVTEI